jgi:hypothetical protein
MNDKIICAKCPWIYTMDEIEAYEGDDMVGTVAQLHDRSGSGTRGRSKKRMFGRAIIGLPIENAGAKHPNLKAIERLRMRTFRCPEGHEVDGSPGDQFPFAVIGASASTKSHVLPGIVRELYDLRALAPLLVKLTGSLYTNPKLKQDLDQLYVKGGALPPTPRGELQGPFSYRLTIGEDAKQHSLMLYDIAGEDLASVVMIADRAQFIVVARALLVLIDPDGFLPSQFDAGRAIRSESMRVDAAHNVREGIRAVADVLREVWEVNSSKEVDVPVCFAVSKADSVDWPEWYRWDEQTRAVMDSVASGEDLPCALEKASSEAREAVLELGGRLVVEEIEDLFADDRVRFAALSATSTMPEPSPSGEQAWATLPRPQGIGLSILQLLDLAGIITPATDNIPA